MKKILVAMLFLVASFASYGQYTGFQRSLNDKPWGYALIDRNSGPVYRGPKAERFEVRQGDCGAQPGWSDCQMDRERSELSELSPYTPMNTPTWYTWSVYIDPTWTDISPVTTTVGQFHQRNQGTPAILFVQRNNVYSMRIESAKALYAGRDIVTLLTLNEMKGRWHTMLVYAVWSTGNDGILEVWVDNVKKVSLRGPNTIYTTPIYFKYGIYRSYVSRVQVRPTSVVYIDEVRKGPSRESVDPSTGKLTPVN